MTGDRQQLLVTLDRIEHVLAEIDRGGRFCEHRGFGSTIDNEHRAGIDNVHAALDALPKRSTLLPELADLTRDRQRAIGLERIPHDEVTAAIRKVTGKVSDRDPA